MAPFLLKFHSTSTATVETVLFYWAWQPEWWYCTFLQNQQTENKHGCHGSNKDRDLDLPTFLRSRARRVTTNLPSILERETTWKEQLRDKEKRQLTPRTTGELKKEETVQRCKLICLLSALLPPPSLSLSLFTEHLSIFALCCFLFFSLTLQKCKLPHFKEWYRKRKKKRNGERRGEQVGGRGER